MYTSVQRFPTVAAVGRPLAANTGNDTTYRHTVKRNPKEIFRESQRHPKEKAKKTADIATHGHGHTADQAESNSETATASWTDAREDDSRQVKGQRVRERQATMGRMGQVGGCA